MNDIELNCFLTAAKYLNFTDAANHLYMSQSAFSRNIARLEKELQVTLFHRDTKNVELTAAGHFLNGQFQSLYKDFVTCIEKAQQLEQGLTGKLSIGLLEGQAMEISFQQSLKEFSEDAPDVKIILNRDGYSQLTQQLKDGQLDGIITLDWEVDSFQEFDFIKIASLESVLVIPRLHPLANKDQVTPEDFADDFFISPSQMSSLDVNTNIANIFKPYGFIPKLKKVTDMQEQLLCLEAGQGIAFINEHNLICHSPSLTIKKCEHFPSSDFVFAWNKENTNPALQRFKNSLQKVLSSHSV